MKLVSWLLIKIFSIQADWTAVAGMSGLRDDSSGGKVEGGG